MRLPSAVISLLLASSLCAARTTTHPSQRDLSQDVRTSSPYSITAIAAGLSESGLVKNEPTSFTNEFLSYDVTSTHRTRRIIAPPLARVARGTLRMAFRYVSDLRIVMPR